MKLTSGKLGLVPRAPGHHSMYWKTKVLYHEDRLLTNQIQVLLQSRCVTLGKLLQFSVPLFLSFLIEKIITIIFLFS